MFDLTVEKCKSCIVGIKFAKFRISEIEMKLNCKSRCGRSKQEKGLDEPDLFTDLNRQDSRFVHGWFIKQDSDKKAS
jgi:hypothetical protein